VQVVVQVFGHVEVDDHVDVGQVQSASCYVGRNQNLELALGEVVQDLLAHVLGLVGVQHARHESLLVQLALQIVAGLLAVAEDDDLVFAQVVAIQEVGDLGELVVVVNHLDHLCYVAVGRILFFGQPDGNRVCDVALGDVDDLRREGGRCHHKLYFVQI